jgi:hypothetical protein
MIVALCGRGGPPLRRRAGEPAGGPAARLCGGVEQHAAGEGHPAGPEQQPDRAEHDAAVVGAGQGAAEFVVATDDGTETQLMQTGEVTALTDTSITVASSDGYTKKYTVEKSTRIGNGEQPLSDLATGDTVTVLARLSGDTATAIFIADQESILPPPGGPYPPQPRPGWDCLVPRAS